MRHVQKYFILFIIVKLILLNENKFSLTTRTYINNFVISVICSLFNVTMNLQVPNTIDFDFKPVLSLVNS